MAHTVRMDSMVVAQDTVQEEVVAAALARPLVAGQSPHKWASEFQRSIR